MSLGDLKELHNGLTAINEAAPGPAWSPSPPRPRTASSPGRAGGKTEVNSNLTTIIILVTVIHVAVLAIMIWIRVRRTEGDGIPVANPKITPCALCGPYRLELRRPRPG